MLMESKKKPGQDSERIQGVLDPAMTAALRTYMRISGVESGTTAAITLLRNYLFSPQYREFLDQVAFHTRQDVSPKK